MKKSVFIIKPGAIKHSRKIKNMIEQTGLKIICSKKVRLTTPVIDKFYDNLRNKKSIRQTTLDYLLGKVAEVGVVQGRSAITRLLRICGLRTNPRECEAFTIRAVFGRKRGKRIGKKYIFWYNAIHRSRDKKEAKRDLKIFADL